MTIFFAFFFVRYQDKDLLFFGINIVSLKLVTDNFYVTSRHPQKLLTIYIFEDLLMSTFAKSTVESYLFLISLKHFVGLLRWFLFFFVWIAPESFDDDCVPAKTRPKVSFDSEASFSTLLLKKHCKKFEGVTVI